MNLFLGCSRKAERQGSPTKNQDGAKAQLRTKMGLKEGAKNRQIEGA
ncbi:MAG: hypothetical protein Fur0025_13180 [Oscillatoriaceae cyanobacterium]